MNMETLAIDSVGLFSSCPEHISSFLEDFQDKNSHLFPSSDLTFSPVELELNPYRIVGHKRKLDLSYDTFSSWTEDLLDPSELAAEADSLVDQISAGSPSLSETTETQTSSFESSSNSQNCEHVDKKLKLSDDEDFALYQTDARSRSPPGYSLLKDDEVDVQPLSLSQPLESVPLVTCKQTTTPSPLLELRNTLLQMDPDTCSALKDSFARLASNTRNGNSPFSVAPQTTMSGKIYLAQDLLTLQLLYGNMNVSPMPVAPVKPERQMTSTVTTSSYYPVAPAGMAYPYMMNSPYTVYPTHPSVPMTSHIMPESNAKCSMPSDMQMYNGSMVSGKSLFSAACSKNMFYTPAPKKFVSPTLIPQQQLYACQPIHVL